MEKVHKTSTVFQMEATECGAASLSMMLKFYGVDVPLEELRERCDITRDGSNAYNLKKAAEHYNMEVTAGFISLEELKKNASQLPAIILWKNCHFMVLEGFKGNLVYLNDPALGRRTENFDTFKNEYSHLAISIAPGEKFQKRKEKKSFWATILQAAMTEKYASFLIVFARCETWRGAAEVE